MELYPQWAAYNVDHSIPKSLVCSSAIVCQVYLEIFQICISVFPKGEKKKNPNQ